MNTSLETAVLGAVACQKPEARLTGRSGWAKRLSREIPLLFKRAELTVSEIAEAQRVTVGTVVSYLPGSTVVERRQHDVRVLRERGLIPQAIGDTLRLSDETVSRYLAELEQAGEIEPVPVYVSR